MYKRQLECCNVELADYIDKVSAVDMSYIYVSGLAFFSSKILDKITESFLPFVESVPELKDAPFSTYTLKNKAYQEGFLNPYIKAVSYTHLTLPTSRRQRQMCIRDRYKRIHIAGF